MNAFRLLAAALLSAPFASPCLAQQNTPAWYGGAGAAYVINDDARTDDHGGAVSAILGKQLDPHWRLEASLQYADLGARDDLATLGADALYLLAPGARVVPYASFGLGYAYEGGLPAGGRNGGAMLRGGGGALIPLGERLRLRLEARYQWHDDGGRHGGLGDWLLASAIEIPFR